MFNVNVLVLHVAAWSSTQPVHGVGCWSSVRSSSCGCKSSEQPLRLSEIQDCYNCSFYTNILISILI